MTAHSVTKHPNDRLDYDVDFSIWLPENDRLESASVSIDGGTATSVQVEHSDTVVKVWIEGGEDGETSEVTVTAQTFGNRTKVFCFKLKIKSGC